MGMSLVTIHLSSAAVNYVCVCVAQHNQAQSKSMLEANTHTQSRVAGLKIKVS